MRSAFTPLTGCSIAAKVAHRDPQQNPDVEPQIGLLDQLFPRVETGGPPGQKQTFADWLPETVHPGARRVDRRPGPLHATGVIDLFTWRSWKSAVERCSGKSIRNVIH